MTLNFVNDTVIRAQKAILTLLPEIAPYDGKPIYQATTFANRSEDERITEEQLAARFELRLSSMPVLLTDRLLFLGEIPRTNDFENKTPMRELPA